MSMSIGPASIALVEFDGRAVQCDAFETRLALVKAVINNGALAVPAAGQFTQGYGSPGHIAALDQVEIQIAETRAKIVEMNSLDSIANAEESIGDADLDDGC